jgi:hypothetical protein
MKSAALVVLSTGILLGASMTQTDWSGGATGEITTTEWGSEFGSCFGMGWQTQGALSLGTALDWAKVSDVGSSLLRTCNVNGDDFSDLLSNRTSIWAYESNGNPYLWPSHVVGSADSILTIFAGDLNGDGLDDAIGGATSLYWWENPNDPNQVWEKRLLDQCFLKGGAVIDYDGDGENDVICVHDVNAMGQLTFYKNLGEGLAWSKSILYQSDWFSGVNCFTLQDVDNDGYLTATMLAQNGLDLIEDSPSGWVYQNTIGTYYTWWPTFVDLDNDGILDFIGCSGPYVYDRIRWYIGPEYSVYHTYEIGETIHGLTCIDFDNDGDMDIIYRGENSVGMFENTRCPQERFVQRVLMEYPFSNGLDSESAGGLVAPGDFDGDGVEDFVCSFYDRGSDLYWWRLGEDYCGSGWLNSDILYVYDASWGELTWEASVPAETQLCFQVRGSDDPTDLGEWSGLITEPVDLSAYLADGESYLQYRVTMLSDNPSVSPQLNSVTVTYDPLGIEENPEFRLSVSPSPATTTAVLRLSLPAPADCTVSVYGLDGRLVERLHGGSLPAGESSFQWDVSSVPSGVYFVRVTGAGVDSSARVAVVR